jgi:DNA-directed RNA polymerase subunit RPC12/RpoP
MLQYICKECKKEKSVDTEENMVFSCDDLSSENEQKITCDNCGSEMEKCLNDVSFSFPVYDLSYHRNYRRFREGLYYDDSSKEKEKAKELNEEMRYNSKNQS